MVGRLRRGANLIAGSLLGAVLLATTSCAVNEPSESLPDASPTVAHQESPTPRPSAHPKPRRTQVARPTPKPHGSTTTLALLASLPVKGRAPKTGYSRSQFGPAWTDDVGVPGGYNGCDTRNDILQRDLSIITMRDECTVASGVLLDPYTGRTINFVRGRGTSSAVQIDHMVALSNAWQTGAQQLTYSQRIDLANDPLNLEAVDGPTNAAKGDGDAATWLPPNRSYRCAYVTRQVQVKAKYHLWVTAAERDAIERQLGGCGTKQPTPPPTTAPAPTRRPTPTPAPASTYYANCSEARAAGAAPLMRGQSGYSSRLDRDGDGVACE